MEKHVGERVGIRDNVDAFEPDRPTPPPVRPSVGEDVLLAGRGDRDDPFAFRGLKEQLDGGRQIAARRELDVRAELVCLFVAGGKLSVRAADDRPQAESASPPAGHNPRAGHANEA